MVEETETDFSSSSSYFSSPLLRFPGQLQGGAGFGKMFLIWVGLLPMNAPKSDNYLSLTLPPHTSLTLLGKNAERWEGGKRKNEKGGTPTEERALNPPSPFPPSSLHLYDPPSLPSSVRATVSHSHQVIILPLLFLRGGELLRPKPATHLSPAGHSGHGCLGRAAKEKKETKEKRGAAQKEVPLPPPSLHCNNPPPSFLGQVEEPQRKKNPAASSRDRKEEKEGGERRGGGVTQPSCNGHEYDEARRCLFFAHFSSDKFHPLFVARRYAMFTLLASIPPPAASPPPAAAAAAAAGTPPTAATGPPKPNAQGTRKCLFTSPQPPSVQPKFTTRTQQREKKETPEIILFPRVCVCVIPIYRPILRAQCRRRLRSSLLSPLVRPIAASRRSLKKNWRDRGEIRDN